MSHQAPPAWSTITEEESCSPNRWKAPAETIYSRDRQNITSRLKDEALCDITVALTPISNREDVQVCVHVDPPIYSEEGRPFAGALSIMLLKRIICVPVVSTTGHWTEATECRLFSKGSHTDAYPHHYCWPWP